MFKTAFFQIEEGRLFFFLFLVKDKKPHISRGEWEVMDLFKGGGAVMGFYEGERESWVFLGGW